MAMSTLSQRLQRVQEPVSDPEFDFSHLSMEQLDNYKIKFGKTHVGKTFSQMWRQEQKWILVVCPALQQEPQMGSPSVPLLCGQEGGALRAVRVEDSGHQQHRDTSCHESKADQHCPDLWRSAESQDDASTQI